MTALALLSPAIALVVMVGLHPLEQWALGKQEQRAQGVAANDARTRGAHANR